MTSQPMSPLDAGFILYPASGRRFATQGLLAWFAAAKDRRDLTPCCHVARVSLPGGRVRFVAHHCGLTWEGPVSEERVAGEKAVATFRQQVEVWRGRVRFFGTPEVPALRIPMPGRPRR